jgi:DTW domain-containing protein YfiP
LKLSSLFDSLLYHSVDSEAELEEALMALSRGKRYEPPMVISTDSHHETLRMTNASPTHSDVSAMPLESSMDSATQLNFRKIVQPKRFQTTESSHPALSVAEDIAQVETLALVQKRFRRKPEEINRFYTCSWPNCNKVRVK